MRLIKCILSKRDLRYYLEALGAIYLLVEFVEYFFPSFGSSFQRNLQFYIAILLPVVYSIIKCIPKKKFEYIIENRDTKVALMVGDALANPGSVIIPINEEFNVDLAGNVMKTKSLQRKIVEKYYDSSPKLLQEEVDKVLMLKKYKKKVDNRKYPMGTVVEIGSSKKTIYLVVNSTINSSLHVSSTKENLEATLPVLWNYLSNEATKENVITIPLLGTGMGRSILKREKVFEEIVRSYIASVSEKCFCNQLIISVYEKDVERLDIDIDKMDDFLRSQCVYSNLQVGSGEKSGTAI